MAGRSCGSVTRRKVDAAVFPSDRDTSSNDGSIRSRAAATGSRTYGYDSRVRAKNAPLKPVIEGKTEM